MEGDWIKIHRKIEHSRVWVNADLFKVWVWCLIRANWRDTWVGVKTGRGGTTVCIKRGQFIFGRKAAGKELKMKPSTVYDRIKKLEEYGNLVTQPGTHFTIITICKYDTYQDPPNDSRQDVRQPTNNQPTTNQQPTGTEEERQELQERQEPKKLFVSGKRKRREYSPEFEAFWGVVANHKRKAKAEAAKRYREAVASLDGDRDNPHEFLLERARAYYASPEGRTQYANGPAPWLNQGRYDDDPAAWERDGDSQPPKPTSDVEYDPDVDGVF